MIVIIQLIILIIPLKLAYELNYPNEKETATLTAGISSKTLILITCNVNSQYIYKKTIL